MKYASCLITNKEGFGSLFQYILSCYFLCKKNNWSFVYIDIQNIEHMSWDGYTSQEDWDKMWNEQIINVFLPRNDVIKYSELPENTKVVINPEYFDNDNENTLFIFHDRVLTKNILDTELNNFPEVLSNLNTNYTEKSTVISKYKPNIINISFHIRRYSKTDCCDDISRELYQKGNQFDVYYQNMIKNLKTILIGKNIEFHLFTQLSDEDPQDIFDHYFEFEEQNVKVTLHKGNDTISDIYHMIMSDIFIMSKSSLSSIVNYYTTAICIIRKNFQHVSKIGTIYNDVDGNLTENDTEIITKKFN